MRTGGSSVVSVLELKRLLFQINDTQADICIRFRLIGKLWWRSFAKIVLIENDKIIFNTEDQSNLLVISNLSDVMEFEVDQAFQNFQPHFHYAVMP